MVPSSLPVPPGPSRPARLTTLRRVGHDGRMRAVVVREHGGSGVLRADDWGDPSPGPGELLVSVAAAGVNFVDIYRREGRPPYTGAVPYVPGAEGAGTVTAVGEGVAGFQPGDRVAWSDSPARYAEHAVVAEQRAVHVPAGVSLELAAAVMLQGMTAHYLCHTTYPVAAGDVAVVHAAAGGVVVATTSTEAKAQLAREAGAPHVAGYADFGAVVREATAGAGAAVVYD